MAPLRATNVTSPVEFAAAWPGGALAKDRLYRLRISESGKPLSTTELTFRTLPYEDRTPDAPDKLLAAYQTMALNPSRLGDALALLLTLSPDLSTSELALRLKLVAFGQLGYAEEFQAAFHSLARN